MMRRPTVTLTALVLTVSVDAFAQATADDGSSRGSSIIAAARDRRAISLSGENGRVDVPEVHDVSRGDTLWDITGKYLGNPFKWPSVWQKNPQVKDAHWIYPGDQIALDENGQPVVNGNTLAWGGATGRFVAIRETPRTSKSGRGGAAARS